jgi:ferredoxin
MSLSFPFPHVDTKLHVPTTRPGLVARPRLSRRLDRCVQHKLLLICAPAGFGKTTLLSQWSRQSARPVAWVSLDATDNDPTHFWSYGVSGVGALTAEEATLFDRVRARYQDLSPIPCTGCGYCMPCPNGVDIPGNLGTYNEGLMYDKPDASRGQYSWWHYAFTEHGILDHDPRAALCVQCGECGKKCPQRIPISKWMPVIHEVLGEGKAYVRSL